jgi:hypothetical protein
LEFYRVAPMPAAAPTLARAARPPAAIARLIRA